MPLLIINYLWVNDLLLDLSDPKDDGDKNYQLVSLFPTFMPAVLGTV